MTVLAFSTGLDSFSNPSEIGPLYPFVGAEWLFVVVGVVLWIGWHVLQIRLENRDNARAVETYERIGLDRVMFYGGSADVPSDEEWARRAEQRARVGTPSAGEPSSDLDEPDEHQHPPVPPGRTD
jgi:hypothetical protein